MFNGIIYSIGFVKKIKKRKKGLNIFINSNIKLKKNNIGMSISCDGVCLTLISYKNKNLEFFLSNETLIKSKFNNIKINDKINLELPLEWGQQISGHICQGHIDTTSKLTKISKQDKAYEYEFTIRNNYYRYLVNKASILVNGVSLTISKLSKNKFYIWLIPHTLKMTNLSDIKVGDYVNIEIDILSKYVNKFINEKK